MLNFKPLKPITEAFFKTANLRATAVMEANCTPERLMETLAGDTVWTEWAPMLKKVEWTSPKPYGPGAKRTVYLAGGQAVKENFFIWEPNRHVAFYVEEGTMSGMDSFAENYEIDVLDNGKAVRLTWTVAIQVTGAGVLFIPVSRFFMELTFKRWLKTYKRILES
ncbi:MAG TPA: SRPBCC family protein [Pseudomonadales bacterium]|nr:SRPBCC family protein [Pseudomonadales bacterium]